MKSELSVSTAFAYKMRFFPASFSDSDITADTSEAADTAIHMPSVPHFYDSGRLKIIISTGSDAPLTAAHSFLPPA